MRNVIAAATIIAVIVIGITIWFQTLGNLPAQPAEVEAPRQRYDTTGGQEMRPRWNNSGGQGDDAAGN